MKASKKKEKIGWVCSLCGASINPEIDRCPKCEAENLLENDLLPDSLLKKKEKSKKILLTD
ncbi:hypothetical protein M0R19_03170 [Candidatus Pacearchaeota archaeon]|jgi:predicted ATP-dependent serine protease|nr:hypothetical protein [Candidatus Pacearchaeota archaeon]